MKLLFFLVAVVTHTVSGLDIIPIPNGLKGAGITTRYWDCCKPSCAWAGNLNGTSFKEPCKSCSADGVHVLDPGAMTGCLQDGSGIAYMCNDQQPRAYNDTIALGFAGASFTGGADVSKCCSCFLLNFQDQIQGKQLIVQVTNTGSDAKKDHFDLAIPGGGVGINNGCAPQWNAPSQGWGDRYGGVHNIEECNELPSQLQAGCKWRFQWFSGADNPNVHFQEIKCPEEILRISDCR